MVLNNHLEQKTKTIKPAPKKIELTTPQKANPKQNPPTDQILNPTIHKKLAKK